MDDVEAETGAVGFCGFEQKVVRLGFIEAGAAVRTRSISKASGRWQISTRISLRREAGAWPIASAALRRRLPMAIWSCPASPVDSPRSADRRRKETPTPRSVQERLAVKQGIPHHIDQIERRMDTLHAFRRRGFHFFYRHDHTVGLGGEFLQKGEKLGIPLCQLPGLGQCPVGQ
jgi:hypothetical protein